MKNEQNQSNSTSVKASGSTKKGGGDCGDETAVSINELSRTLAKKETKAIAFLRVAVILVLIVTAILWAYGAYHYTRNNEKKSFTSHFKESANQVVRAFHESMENNIGAVAAMSSTITSFAMKTNATFPFVTVPDFEALGSHLRVQSGSHIVHYAPIVTDDLRDAWEEYAMEHRSHIDESFELDKYYRSTQDMEFPVLSSTAQGKRRRLAEGSKSTGQEEEGLVTTVLEDDTGYHPRIWRNQAVTTPGDEPEGGGPYIPLWQRRYEA